MPKHIRIRSGYKKREPYPLNEFPIEVIQEIAKQIVHRAAIGISDLGGDDFPEIFAATIGGFAFQSPLGIADIAADDCCWSVKTVKNSAPHTLTVKKGNQVKQKVLRLIIGRNSPIYAAGITDVMANPAITGRAVLEIYNARVDEARQKYNDLRFLVFVRNMAKLEFTIFEQPLIPFAVNECAWEVNENGNLEGWQNGTHLFTWQPHGTQFTTLLPIPSSATRFRIIRKIAQIQAKRVLQAIGFEDNWIERL